MTSRLILVFSVAFLSIASACSGELIPFPLPWDDATSNITNVSELLEKPAGKHGFVQIDENGRFVDGAGKRIRFLGVNTAFTGDFPDHDVAEGVAARMARFGINCVRIHHHDTLRAPSGVWKEGVAPKQELDPDVMDRLDYFVAQLKKNGIYVDLNLKVGREMVAADGLTHVDQLPTYDKGPDHYVPRMIELQKQFARDYLTHKNPYTGLAYVDDPVVALVEINNESGLLNAWRNGDIDSLPEEYQQPLQQSWNEFLSERYGSTEKVRQAWAPPASGSGEELLKSGLNGWNLQVMNDAQGAKGKLPGAGPDGIDALQLDVNKVGSESWYIQLVYQNLSLQADKVYKAVLWMKADPSVTISTGIRMNHDPWSFLDTAQTVPVTNEWKRFEFLFSPSQNEPVARFDVSGFGGRVGSLWLAGASLTESQFEGLPDAESLENESVSWFPQSVFARKTETAKHDWYEFIVGRETAYNREMYAFLKNELGVQSLVTGSQLGFSTVLSQLPLDYIDDHAYWKHPVFPNRAWDAVDWYVDNESIVSNLDNSLLTMMRSRIAGRPYTVSEYNHPAPNTYASEAIPLLAAYAAFQDWDGIFYFAYSHSNQYRNKSINNFFDIAGHTPKMLAMPIAANILLRGDVAIGEDPVYGSLSSDQYLNGLMQRNGSLWQRPIQYTDIPANAPYFRRVATRIGEEPEPNDNPEIPTSQILLRSDTGELTWHHQGSEAYVVIAATDTRGFIGFKPFRGAANLGGGVSLELGDLMQNWANVLMSRMKTDDDGDHWLLVATGYSENDGMKWNANKTSVGANWGSGPPLVEAPPLLLNWKGEGLEANLFALDNRGGRSQELSSAIQPDANGDGFSVNLMDSNPALWYELVIRDTAGVSNGNLYETP